MKDIYELLNHVDIDIEEYEDIELEVPEKLSSNLIKDFKGHMKRNKKKTHKYGFINFSKAAAVTIVLIGALTISNNAFAKNIPLIGKFMDYLKINSTVVNSEYVNYANDLSLESKDKNITVKLNSVVCDGQYMYFSYQIKGESNIIDREQDININQLTVNNSPIELEKSLVSDKQSNKYKSYDTEINYGDGSAEAQRIITKVDLSQNKIDENAKIHLSFNKLGDISGKWDFKFQISKSELFGKTKRYDNLGQMNITDNIKFDLNSITFSPLGTTIENTIIAPKKGFDKIMDGKYTNLGFGYVLVTDKGEEIFQLGEKNIHEDVDTNTLELRRYSRFTATKELPKSLTIIPVIQKKGFDYTWNFDEYKWIKLKDIKPGQYIAQGKDCGVVINSVTKKGEETVLNITFTGLDVADRSKVFVTSDINRYKEYLNMKEGKSKDKTNLEIVVDAEEALKNYDITRRYSEKGNEYTFKNINDNYYLAVPQYDQRYELDRDSARTIYFNK